MGLKSENVQRIATTFRVIAALTAVHATAAAQTVTGRVAGRASDRPMPSVIVQLIDSTNAVAAQTFAGATGEFSLTAVRAGSYTVRALHLGFRPVVSEKIILRVAETGRLDELVMGDAVSLDTIRVTGRSECREVQDAAGTFAVWEQARNALVGVSMRARSSVVNATIIQFQRTLEPRGNRIREQVVNTADGFITKAWVTLPVDSLRKVGYVVIEPNGWRSFYAPDMNVLLSDAFVTGHCFRLSPTQNPSEISIAFEPKKTERGVSGIRGSLSLDRGTSELRRLDFLYTNLSEAEERARAGGHVEFRRMRNDRWIIVRWEIRMPLLEQVLIQANSGRARVSRLEVTGIRVAGGALASVTQGSDTLWSGAQWVLRGTVRDSITNVPIAKSHVALRGTGFERLTNATGHFEIAGILPGDYALDVLTPELSSLGVSHSTRVSIADSMTTVTVRAPNAGIVARQQCGGSGQGLIAGLVRGAGGAMPHARVLVEWRKHVIAPDSVSGAGTANHWFEVQSDSRGTYRICQAPMFTDITLSASSPTGVSDRTTVRITADSFAIVDLTADRPWPESALLTGIVISDFNAAPIVDVAVSIPSLARTVQTTSDGRFRLPDVPPGVHRVLVRRVGWQPRELEVRLSKGERVDRQLVLSRVHVLDTVAIAERRQLNDFDEHRRIGLGKFLTREDLARRESSRLGDILRSLPGVAVTQSNTGTQSWLVGARPRSLSSACLGLDDVEGAARLDSLQGKTCSCFAQVYLDGMRVYGGAGMGVVPDLNRFSPAQIEAIEYYSGPAETPAKYSTLNSSCGVLVIHTRR